MMELQTLSRKGDSDRLDALLRDCGIRLPETAEQLLGFVENGRLLACAGRAGNVIVGAAVHPDVRGQGLLSPIVSALMREIRESGYDGAFVFTKPERAGWFASLGFDTLAQTGDAALLYSRRDAVSRWANALLLQAEATADGIFGRQSDKTTGIARAAAAAHNKDAAAVAANVAGEAQDKDAAATGANVAGEARDKDTAAIGCIVMHANPFTNGHRYLVEQAAQRCARLYVFVLEHAGQDLPFDARMQLVRAGTAHVTNAVVLPGGPFMISQATFPSYFLKEASDAARVHAALDATLFAARIAPAFGVTARFVGTEPLDALTRDYNRALAAILPEYGVTVHGIERLCCGGAPVSASRVRADWAREAVADVRALVPETTFALLMRMRETGGRV